MAGTEGFGSWRHLAARFFGALSPAGPPADDERWALGHLGRGEQVLWHRMSGADRRHAVDVARRTRGLLEPDEPPREVIAAALLHDVGKVESGFGTLARVGVTLAAIGAGRERLVRWAGDGSGGDRPDGPAPRRSVRTRVGLYLTHDRRGADLLDAAGSHPLTSTWAREHHLAESRWSVDHRVATALKVADGD